MSELPTREEVHDAWNAGWPMGKYDIVVHDYAYGELMTRAEWEASIEQCRHQHITAIREVYRDGEFEGFEYDECEISGRNAL